MSGLRRKIKRAQVYVCAFCTADITADRFPSIYDDLGVRLESFCDPVCLELKHPDFARHLPGVPA